MTTLEYRTRFKTSKRKLPKFYATIFSVGDEIEVEICCCWWRGLPDNYQSYQLETVIIDCMDDYAIVCKYKNADTTILIIDWVSLRKGTYVLDKEVNKRFENLKATAIEKFNTIEL